MIELKYKSSITQTQLQLITFYGSYTAITG